MRNKYLTVDSNIDNWKNENIEAIIDGEFYKIFPSRSIKKVLLIQPPDADSTLFDYNTGKRGRYWNFPPYGLGILASCLNENKIESDIINLNNIILNSCLANRDESTFNFHAVMENVLDDKIKACTPDLIGITCMFSQTHQSLLEVIKLVRTLHPKIPIALGGVHVTNSIVNAITREPFLSDVQGVKLFFLYEAENSFIDFVQAVLKTKKIKNLTQLLIRCTDKDIYLSARSTPNNADLNRIPAHQLMEISDLSNNGKIGSFFCLKPEKTILSTVLFNRGCRGSCTFCSVRQFNGKGVRGRSIQSTIDELMVLRDKYNVGHIMWLDDDLL